MNFLDDTKIGNGNDNGNDDGNDNGNGDGNDNDNGIKLITVEYVQANFDEVLEKIDVVVRDASLKILDAHNRAILEYEIDLVANKIRSNIGDNIAFEIFVGGLYSEFSADPSIDMAETVIYRLRTSKYCGDVSR